MNNDSNDITIISVDPEDNGVDKLSEVFELGKIIPLETTEGSFLGRIDKFSVHDSLIVVLDEYVVGKVLVFNINGEFKYNSGNPGKGPLELLLPNDYCVRGDFLYILSADQAKIVKYRLSSGEPIEEFKVSLGGFQLCAVDNETFILQDLHFGELVICENNFKEIHRYKKSSWFNYNPTFKPFENDGEQVLYTNRMSDTIFSISRSEMHPRYIIDFGKSNITQRHINQCKSEEELMILASLKGLCSWFGRFSIWDNSVFFTYKNGDDDMRCIANIKSGKNILYSWRTKDDIIGMPYSPAVQHVDTSGFYFSSNFTEIEPFIKSKLPHLDENSNPIIFRYQLKEL